MQRNPDELDLAFQALADPSRRTIVDRLSRGPASVSELARPLEMSLPAVVHHLGILEASGLISTRKTGRVRMCRLDSSALARAGRWILERRTATERQYDRLRDFLETEPEDESKGDPA